MLIDAPQEYGGTTHRGDLATAREKRARGGGSRPEREKRFLGVEGRGRKRAREDRAERSGTYPHHRGGNNNTGKPREDCRSHRSIGDPLPRHSPGHTRLPRQSCTHHTEYCKMAETRADRLIPISNYVQ
ncbi:hypothetical protein AAG570_009576 [Ranatra chinensis]|uniref:Uncharacterized protein n=1 Tax=Ranatra chinensis TaxID=642074 RepID=A0ABD0YPG9_9HEMI